MVQFLILTLVLSYSEAFSSFDARIVGGQEASLGQFPYQVVVYLIEADNKTYICGGSIIDNNWILTAGHCTFNRVRAIVIAGTVDLSGPTPDQQVIFVNDSDYLITHPNYTRKKVLNDIALIRLPQPLNYTDHIDEVDLRINDKSYYVGKNVTASGFGKTSDSSKPSKTLMWTTLTVITNQVCARSYQSGLVDNTKLCTSAGTRFKPHSTCQGDSGGPLVLTESLEQIGLVSFGGDSCQRGTPVAFTRVSAHKGFIEDTTGISFYS
ncbi:hypothetical protein ACFFRR_008991 [Megaselia abdita]